MKKKIYMSSPALICCAGLNKEEFYNSCLTGNQGGLVMSEPLDNGKKYPVGYIPKELPEVDLPQSLAYMGKTKIIRIINSVMEQLRPVIEKAIANYGKQKIGVCMGSCDIGSESILAQCEPRENSKLIFHGASTSVEYISRKFDISGPAFTVANACASGASAIAMGVELIRSGQCDAVIAGGADAVTKTVFAGFHSIEAVSDELTNPFSKNRKGINLGEGAAFFLLEAEQNSRVQLLGFGESADAFSMVTPGTDGKGPVQAMQNALAVSEVDRNQIQYVNLHGTGTELNDKAEAVAMKTVFGGETTPLASSTKSVTGHTLGAAGALEAAICWMVLNEQKGLPLHCWDEAKDEEASISLVNKVNQNLLASICMSNSFGFGGCNVSLIMGRC